MRNLRRFFSSWQNIISLIVITTFAVLALAAPWISPMASKEPGIFQRVGRSVDYEPHPPNEKALLGTMPGQFDVFHAIVWGIAEALRFGLTVAVVSALVGVSLGAVAGYAGGFINSTIMRFTDAFLAFPVIAGVVFIQQMVAITITSMGGMYYFNTQFLGKIVEVPTPLVGIQALLQKSDPLLISLILFSWMPFTRLVNTLVITLKQTGFVQAARALGAGPFWIICRHLMPHTIAPVLVLAARDVGAVVIFQATLTFIGIGGNSTWGSILAIGRDWVLGPGGNLFAYWWVFMPATLAVVFFGVAWNLLADGINEVSLPPSKMPDVDYLPGKVPVIVNETPSKFITQDEDHRMAYKSERQPILPAGVQVVSLTKARASLREGKTQEAVDIYRALLSMDRLVEKVIQDMKWAVECYPQEVSFWEVLGEAYNHNGQLSQAIEAYSQAIERYRRISLESSLPPPK
jgi:peptide/nickel transport system permease protein